MNAQRVLVFLALHPRPLVRSYVAQTLWLEVTEKRADGNFRMALCTIGKLEPTILDKTARHISLSPVVNVDLHRSTSLATRLQNHPQSVDESELQENMLFNDLLPDWNDEWILREQEHYRQLRLHALESLCLRLVSLGEFGRAIQAGLAAVAADPLGERANLVLMQAYLAEGNAGAALRQYRVFERLLSDELGIGPSPSCTQVFQSLSDRISLAGIKRRDARPRTADHKNTSTSIHVIRR